MWCCVWGGIGVGVVLCVGWYRGGFGAVWDGIGVCVVLCVGWYRCRCGAVGMAMKVVEME